MPVFGGDQCVNQFGLQRVLLRRYGCSGPLLLPFGEAGAQNRFILGGPALGHFICSLLSDERLFALQRFTEEKINSGRIVGSDQRKYWSHVQRFAVQRNTGLQQLEAPWRVVAREVRKHAAARLVVPLRTVSLIQRQHLRVDALGGKTASQHGFSGYSSPGSASGEVCIILQLA